MDWYITASSRKKEEKGKKINMKTKNNTQPKHAKGKRAKLTERHTITANQRITGKKG